jgi:hypothetical protein
LIANDVAVELAAAVGQTLPTPYLVFLDQLPKRPTLGEGYGPILDFNGRCWRPHFREELSKSVRYNRGTTFPMAHETAAIAEDLLSGSEGRQAEMTSVLKMREFAVERLAKGFCIGDDGNGEPVFVDPQTGCIFAYSHDGMDVELWAQSLIEFIAGSFDKTYDDDTEPMESD